MLIGVYPATFDPPTKGHLDIIARSVSIVDKLIVAVAVSKNKGPNGPLFTLQERVDMLKEEVEDLKKNNPSLANANIEVKVFDKPLTELAEHHNARIIICGLRDQADFERYSRIEQESKVLNPSIQTIFLLASYRFVDVSSTNAKNVNEEKLGTVVSEKVSLLLKQKLKERNAGNKK